MTRGAWLKQSARLARQRAPDCADLLVIAATLLTIITPLTQAMGQGAGEQTGSIVLQVLPFAQPRFTKGHGLNRRESISVNTEDSHIAVGECRTTRTWAGASMARLAR